MVATKDILDRHLKYFSERDLNGILSDYAADAFMFTANGPLAASTGSGRCSRR